MKKSPYQKVKLKCAHVELMVIKHWFHRVECKDCKKRFRNVPIDYAFWKRVEPLNE